MHTYTTALSQKVLRTLCCVLVALTFCAPARAEEPGLTMDFKEADIQSVIAYISESTGYNFVVDPAVKGKITVYSPAKLTKDEAFSTFASILGVHGYSIVKSGSTYRIVPSKEAVGQSSESGVGTKMSQTMKDSLITQIIPLKVGVATELAKILPPMLGKDHAISPYAPSNTIAITASYDNLAKAMAFIEEVESSRTQGSTITLPLGHGDSRTLSTSLSKILKSRDDELGKKGKPSVSLVVPDERTNSLMVYGDQDSLDMVRQTISRLDIPTPKGKGDVHLIALSNAKAEELATVINTLVERQQASSTAEDQAKDMVLSRDIKVVADKATNSLVITARPDEFDALESIVKKLDIRRKQVFIEALIMEVSSDSSFAFGINWALGGSIGKDGALIGGANIGGGSVSLNSTAGMVTLPAGGSIGGFLRDVFTIGGTSYNVQGIINAVRDNTDVEILATPQLLTLDNEEASVEVVDNVPFTKETTTRNDNDFTTQSMDYKDVGVKLKITPRISENGSMRLELEQEVSRITQGLITLANGEQLVAPTTRKRAVKTTILMQDGQTAVIAGLLGDNETHNQSKVPGLGDVPLMGWLFKSKRKESSQTNLFIFITPRVIRNVDDIDTLTSEKKLALHETNIGKDGLGLPIMSLPIMAPATFTR